MNNVTHKTNWRDYPRTLSVPTAEDFVRRARITQQAEDRERRNFYLTWFGIIACCVVGMVVILAWGT